MMLIIESISACHRRWWQ